MAPIRDDPIWCTTLRAGPRLRLHTTSMKPGPLPPQARHSAWARSRHAAQAVQAHSFTSLELHRSTYATPLPLRRSFPTATTAHEKQPREAQRTRSNREATNHGCAAAQRSAAQRALVYTSQCLPSLLVILIPNLPHSHAGLHRAGCNPPEGTPSCALTTESPLPFQSSHST